MLVPNLLSLRLPRLVSRFALITTLSCGVTIAQAQNAGPIVSSPASGVVFQDAPQLLPVDTRFSQAIQTIAIDLGSTCEQVESYGWTIDPSQQDRVNTIFTQTAQELARLGYSVTPQSPSSAAADITVYTAARPDKNVLFTWSAGTTGLLLLMCETKTDIVPKGFGPAFTTGADGKPEMTMEPDSLVGEWAGTYSCLGQGPTGGTLTVSRVAKDKDGYSMSGQFSFYPLKDKNPNQPRGSYRVKGRYDSVAQRAILEPGAWIQRPANYYDAVMIAQFNAAQKRVSAVYQGTTGCTSFEAAYKDGSADRAARKYAEDDKPVVKKKPKPKAKPKPVVTEMPAIPADAPIADLPMDAPVSTEVVAPATPTADMEVVAPATPNVVETPDPMSVQTPSPTDTNANSAADTVTIPEKPPVQ